MVIPNWSKLQFIRTPWTWLCLLVSLFSQHLGIIYVQFHRHFLDFTISIFAISISNRFHILPISAPKYISFTQSPLLQKAPQYSLCFSPSPSYVYLAQGLWTLLLISTTFPRTVFVQILVPFTWLLWWLLNQIPSLPQFILRYNTKPGKLVTAGIQKMDYIKVRIAIERLTNWWVWAYTTGW